MLGFTGALASRVGEYGVTVNAIRPGIIRTPRLDGTSSAEQWEMYRGRQAIKTIAEPKEYVSAPSMLVDDQAR